AAIAQAALFSGDAFESVDETALVAVGLQLADEPRAGVGERFVIEIDGILRGEQDADAERSRLFEERHERQLARRIGGVRRQIAQHLVEKYQRPQARRVPLLPRPPQYPFERQRGAQTSPRALA